MLLENKHWDTLLTRIRDGRCTPFLGAAVNKGFLPLGAQIATEWAKAFGYPLDTRTDLAKVAQFVAIDTDFARPKELMIEKLKTSLKAFDKNDPNEPLNVLAKLPLPLYLTTNYDDLLADAINHHGRKAVTEICRWNSTLKRQLSGSRRGSRYPPMTEPRLEAPVVFHLHGHHSLRDSLVLTEDDYLDYLVRMSREEILPTRVQEAITGSSLLFIGYSLADINFRVLFRGLLGNLEASLEEMSVSVQLPYDAKHPHKKRAEAYVTAYLGRMKGTALRVYWGDARSFARELWRRWKAFRG